MLDSAFPGPVKLEGGDEDVSPTNIVGFNLLASIFGSSNAGSPSRSNTLPRRRLRRGKTMTQVAVHPRSSYCIERKWEPSKVLEMLNRIDSVLHLAKQEGTLFYPSIELGQIVQKIMNTLHAELMTYFKAAEMESLFGRVLLIEKELPSFAKEIGQVIMRIIFSNKYILGLFSSNDLIKFVECLPLESALALLYVEDTKPFRRDFRKLLEFYYRWACETVTYWTEIKETSRVKFYNLSIGIFAFFNQLILQERADDPNVIEKELPYFDVLFSLYQMMNGSSVLEHYSSPSHQAGDETNINNLHIERCQLLLGLKLGADSGTRIEMINSSVDPKFDMLLYLLHSLGIASKRFVITDTSHTIRRNMCTFMSELLTFVDKNIRLTQMSLDEEKAELVADKTIIFQGYSQLVAREGQTIDAIESAAEFVAEASNDKTLTNKYSIILFPVIMNLQNNLAFCYEEGLLDLDTEETLLETKSGSTLHRAATEDSAGDNNQQDGSKSENMNRAPSFFTTTQPTDKEFTHETLKQRNLDLAHNTIPHEEIPKWRPGKTALLEVCTSNLRLLASQMFNTMATHLPEYSWRVLSAFTRQVVLLMRKFDLQPKTLGSYGISLEMLTKFFYSLLRTFQQLKFDSPKFHGEALEQQMKQVENTITEIMDLVHHFQEHWKIPLELTNLRRVPIYFDETNLSMLRKTMENSGKYQSDIKPYVNNSYYKNILKGRVEMEVESRELTYGVARSFIKIFQKMQMRGDLPKFEKLELSIRGMFEQNYNFINLQKDALYSNEQHKFLLSFHTNYFYNDVFRRASVIFEMLLIEVPEIRYAIYSEHLKNYMILKFFSNKTGNLKIGHPSIKNFYDLSINLSGYCFRSLLLNDNFGIIHSRFFHTLSLLNNFTLENFNKYKEVSFKLGYYDTNIKLYQSEENFFDEMLYFERDQTFVVTICCRLDTWLKKNGFYDKLKLGKLFGDDFIATSIPLLTTWIELLDSLIDESRPDLCQYVYNKLFLSYFLKILFGYDDMSNINLIHFKKAIASLYFRIGTPDILENTLKYQFDLKSIYDSIIKVTRIQFLALIDAQRRMKTKDKNSDKKQVAATARERRRLRKQEEERDSLALFKTIGTFTQKNVNSRPHIFDPFAYEKLTTEPGARTTNIILFSGAMFYALEGQMGQRQYENRTNCSLDDLIACYKTSDNRDLGFQFINSLVKILNKFEFAVGTKFWSTRKENARVYFEIEQTPLSEVKKFELKIVYLLSMMNKQIEVVNQEGQNILISFRKYPEIYTVNQLDPIKYMPEFHFEDFKRDTLKINSHLSTMTSIEYRIMQASGRFYKLLSSDALRKYPYIPWYFNMALNIFIIINYLNTNQENSSSETRFDSLNTVILVFGYIVLGISSLSLLIWLFTRFQTIKLANKYNFGTKADVDIPSNRHVEDTPITILLRKLFSWLLDHPYFAFIKSIFGDPSAVILIIHIVVSVLGLYVDQLVNGFGILTFIYTSSTAQNVLRSITTNLKPILIALCWILLEVNFYTVIWFFNFYEYFDPAVFPEDGHPCHTLAACYFTVINYGIRMGGGLGEVTRYVPESATNFETKILFDLSFFFFVNITGLNLIFGIIIDTFGQLREDANEKRSIMESVCLVCGVHKTDFEASGINFQYHVKQQHNLSDYAAFLIRLQINKNRLSHDIDYKIKKHLDNLEVSWFPNRSTYFIRSLKNAEKQADDPVMVKLNHLEATVASVEEALDKLGNRVLIPTKTLVDDK